MTDALTLRSVTIDYRSRKGTTRILDDVTFSIPEGGAFGLVGESGCGKSTVALAAMRYLPRGMAITKGEILLDGRDVSKLTEAELRSLRGNRVAMVYQDPMSSLNPVMTIGKQLVEVPMLHGETSRAKAEERALAMLHEVRLPDAAAMMQRYPHQLSGGQQQRVVIAMALMAEPKLLVMDEPTTGLDVTIEAAILELVRELRRKFGTSILFISHNLGTVARLCDGIGVLYAGRLVEAGPIRAVFKTPQHPYTRGLLAALPKLDAGRGAGRLHPIEGTIAASDRAIPGCAFSSRCPFVVASRCVPEPLPLRPASGIDGHLVRCARLGEIPAAAVTADLATPVAEGTHHGEPLLTLEHLTKHYELRRGLGGRKRSTVRALTDASLTAKRGETLAIVGESGSGKSTLAKVVSGLHGATSGAARIGGADIAQTEVDDRPRELRRRIQMVFQNPDSTLNPSHSVAYALTRPLKKLADLARGETKDAVAKLMARVKLPAELAQRYPHQLSGGQRQRVALARALAGNPDLIIADEPVSALDVSVQAAIVNLLDDLRAEADIGLVLISHDLALVRHMADWVAVMYLGRIVEQGPADRVFAPPYHPYTEALLAAAPKPDPDAPEPSIILSGNLPSVLAEIKGCPFASRCVRKIDGLCDTVQPPVREPVPGHTIYCHLELGPVTQTAALSAADDRPVS